MVAYFFRWVLAVMVISCNGTSHKPIQNDKIPYEDKTAIVTDSLPAVMQHMIERNERKPLSGDNDRDFAFMMIEHHDAVIDIAKLQIENGDNKRLKIFSRKVIEDQVSEIEKLTRFIENEPAKRSSSAKEFQNAIREAGNVVLQDKIVQGANVDTLVAQFMLQLNVEAEQLAHAELKYGSHQTLKILARNIIGRQAEGTRWLKTWLIKNE
ncbi:DUF305 domain-containing protein [Cnuella takakiae]|nr:DUF305 domain-containing protein [Cnuella takakiae]OLY95662.1 hypothetical protein BUE76_00120 [Cnuella takakiae]